MSTTKVGIQRPADLKDGLDAEVYQGYRSDTGMEYTLYETSDGITALIGVSPESGGETVWYRTDDLDEGMSWIEDKLDTAGV